MGYKIDDPIVIEFAKEYRVSLEEAIKALNEMAISSGQIK